MSKKYDLLLVNTATDKTIREQPWYKERLKTKLIKSMDKKSCSKFLNSKDWTFVKDGLDDFRDGLPPPSHDGDLLTRPKGLAPTLTGPGSTESMTNIKDTVNRHRFTKNDVCYSKLTPLQKQKRDQIDEMEYGLLQHPLALYPHLENGVAPDLFEDIVDLLDPEMNIASDEEYDEMDSVSGGYSTSHAREGSFMDTKQTEETGNNTQHTSRMASQLTARELFKNMYKWIPKKEESNKKSKKKSQEIKLESPSQDQHIKTVTQDFCEWVAGLGGDSNNIEESTIYSLFASGYETKPALSVPIHVVELTNVPPELRMTAAAAIPEQEEDNATIPAVKNKSKNWSYSFGNYEPSCAKFRYGAWYLPPKSWKKRDWEEQLVDPKKLKEQDQTEMKKKSDDLDAQLAPIHGSEAFMEFISMKSYRKPEFLNRVAEIQKMQRDDEEKVKAENETRARGNARNLVPTTS